MERPPSSECVTAAGSGDVGDPVRDGFRVDAKRQHKSIRERASGCKPI